VAPLAATHIHTSPRASAWGFRRVTTNNDKANNMTTYDVLVSCSSDSAVPCSWSETIRITAAGADAAATAALDARRTPGTLVAVVRVDEVTS